MVPTLARALSLILAFQQALAVTQIAISDPQSQQLDSWLEDESDRALQSILDNIGPNGTYALDAHPGVVVASPSRDNPNCMEKNYPVLHAVKGGWYYLSNVELADDLRRLFYVD